MTTRAGRHRQGDSGMDGVPARRVPPFQDPAVLAEITAILQRGYDRYVAAQHSDYPDPGPEPGRHPGPEPGPGREPGAEPGTAPGPRPGTGQRPGPEPGTPR